MLVLEKMQSYVKVKSGGWITQNFGHCDDQFYVST